MFSSDDYHRKYRDMPFVRLTDDSAAQQTTSDTLAVLAAALDSCLHEDMR